MIKFTLKHPEATYEMLGFLPEFFSEDNPLPAREQVNHNYRHGGGWRPFKGFVMTENALEYPGDPPQPLLAEAKLRDETLRLYNCSWLAIVQPDGTYEIGCVD